MEGKFVFLTHTPLFPCAEVPIGENYLTDAGKTHPVITSVAWRKKISGLN